MVKVNIVGKTLEEAISKAVVELNVTSDSLEYEVVQNGSRGFFGIGSKNFIIEAYGKSDKKKENQVNEVNEDKTYTCEKEVKEVSKVAIDQTIKFLKDTVANMGLEVEVKVEKVDESCIRAELIGSGLDFVIGKDGITLDSLQYLASRVASKHNTSYVKVKLDANNFRRKRKDTINKMAMKAANNACENRTDIKLKSMNPYERRLVHASLQGDSRVKTNSVGSEPYRYVVVSPVK